MSEEQVLSIATIDPTIKAQMKDQRLKMIQSQWFEYTMNKIGFEANGLTAYVEEMDRKLLELQNAYNAILSLDIS